MRKVGRLKGCGWTGHGSKCTYHGLNDCPNHRVASLPGSNPFQSAEQIAAHSVDSIPSGLLPEIWYCVPTTNAVGRRKRILDFIITATPTKLPKGHLTLICSDPIRPSRSHSQSGRHTTSHTQSLVPWMFQVNQNHPDPAHTHFLRHTQSRIPSPLFYF